VEGKGRPDGKKRGWALAEMEAKTPKRGKTAEGEAGKEDCKQRKFPVRGNMRPKGGGKLGDLTDARGREKKVQKPGKELM